MTTMIITIVIFMLMLLMGFPVAYAMGIAGMWGLLDFGTVSDVMAAQKCFSTMNSFTLMAVPFYILAGELMNTGGITRKLIRFCSLLLQHWRGALAHANVLVSMIMAGFAGSATADAVSVGAIMIPAMEEDGYTPEFSAGVTAASSCIGPIIPPQPDHGHLRRHYRAFHRHAIHGRTGAGHYDRTGPDGSLRLLWT